MTDVPQSAGAGRHFDYESGRFVATPESGSPEAIALVDQSQREADALQRATLHSPPTSRADVGPYPVARDFSSPLPLSKHTRVRLEAVRTISSCVSALGTVVVLLRLWGIL